MKVKSFKKLKNKYKIFLENGEVIDTFDDVIIKNNILYKKDLSIDDINKIDSENIYYESYDKIVKYIGTKLRSEYEIRKYMDKLEIDDKTREDIIERLKGIKLIDDQMYVKAYIHDRIFLTNDGPNKIKKELLGFNIDSFIIDNEIEKIDACEIFNKLERLIQRRIKTNSKYSESVLRQKLLNYFMNLGYNKNDIINILDSNKFYNNDILMKEYNKLYNKLKFKYSDEELKFRIKQKLYQKGFNLDQINNIVN